MTAGVGNSQSWLRRFPRERASGRHRLICFPHAGGSASYFKTWPQHLPEHVEVIAIQYPGREDRIREPLIDSMSDLADQLASIVSSNTSRPFSFFGHSMGAAVAYEVALRLDSCLPLSHLFVSAHPAPHRERCGTPPKSDHEFLAELSRLSGPSLAGIDLDDIRDLMLPVLRNDYSLICNYKRTRPPLIHIPVSAFCALHDLEATEDEVASWRDVTTKNFAFRFFDGGHFYLSDQVHDLTAAIALALDSPVEGSEPATICRGNLR